VNCFSATSVNAVGITQLLAPSIQGQPNLSGSKCTCRSEVLNFQRHSQWPSRPRVFKIQATARSRADEESFKTVNAGTTSAVVQEASGSPRNAGQAPSLRWVCNKNWPALLALMFASASPARQVASMLAWADPVKLHPPCGSSRRVSSIAIVDEPTHLS
jgi:hypothetical protein